MAVRTQEACARRIKGCHRRPELTLWITFPSSRPISDHRIETSHDQLLHQPADLRHSTGPADALGWWDLHLHPADLALSRYRTTPGSSDDNLHRRRCSNRRRYGHDSHRATD